MAWMAAWCRCCLPARESLLDEMQAQTEALLEMRNDQRELLNLQKDWSELAAAATEEPATLDSTEVVERTEIAQKVFREEPYAENTLVVQNITTFFGCGSKYELEKVKGPKKFSLIKIKVIERLKNVRFVTGSNTREVMGEKHKDVLTVKGVVQDRAKSDALFKLLLELARAVYKERVVETNTGTISNLTKAQVAFIWAVALCTLHKTGRHSCNGPWYRAAPDVTAHLEPCHEPR